MKKRVFGFLAAMLLCAALLPAPEAHAAGETINVYNWGQYISDGSDGYIDVNAAMQNMPARRIVRITCALLAAAAVFCTAVLLPPR